MAADPIDIIADDAAARALELLQALRREVLASIVAAGSQYATGYRTLLAEIDAQLVVFGQRARGVMQTALTLAADAGNVAALRDARAAGITAPVSYTGVSETLVRTASEYTFNLLDGVSAAVRARITREVRLAALGGLPYTDLLERIGRDLNKTPQVFTDEVRSVEMVARTEVARLRNMAYADQGQELAARMPGTMKRWIHSVQAPGATTHQRYAARANHIACAEETAANPIAFDALFDLGDGITARYPHDPVLSAKETVGCRCRLMLVAP